MFERGMMKLALFLVAIGLAAGAGGCLVSPGGSSDDPPPPDLSLEGGVLDPEPHPAIPPMSQQVNRDVSIGSLPVITPPPQQGLGGPKSY